MSRSRKSRAKNAQIKTATLVAEIDRIESLEEPDSEDAEWLAVLIEEVDSRLDEIGRTEWQGQL